MRLRRGGLRACRVLAKQPAHALPHRASAGLTPRDREILALLAQGRNAPFIVQALSLSTGTVKNHISSIYRKVDVSDRQGLLNLLERRPETQG